MCYHQQPVHEEDYKGFTIKIHQDDNGSNLNPYENGDYMYPMLVKYGRSDTREYLDASAAFYPTTNQYRRHKKALWDAIGAKPDMEYGVWGSNIPVKCTASEIEQQFTELLDDAIREHDYEKLEAVGKVLGVPCLNTSSRGYSQGDYMDLLVVWTPAFGKTTGITKKNATYKSMEANAKEYGAWAWNDIYGFTIEDQDGNEIKDGSCWGFIESETYPAEKMYVVREARSMVDAHIEHERKKHAEQLKTWIRSRTPYQYRQPLQIGA